MLERQASSKWEMVADGNLLSLSLLSTWTSAPIVRLVITSSLYLTSAFTANSPALIYSGCNCYLAVPSSQVQSMNKRIKEGMSGKNYLNTKSFQCKYTIDSDAQQYHPMFSGIPWVDVVNCGLKPGLQWFSLSFSIR